MLVAPERRCHIHRLDIRRDHLALPSDEIADCLAKAWVGDEMRRYRRHRAIAARQLVRALGAGLDPRQAMSDRPFDGLIIAKLEVEERDVLAGAPVSEPVSARVEGCETERVSCDRIARSSRARWRATVVIVPDHCLIPQSGLSGFVEKK